MFFLTFDSKVICWIVFALIVLYFFFINHKDSPDKIFKTLKNIAIYIFDMVNLLIDIAMGLIAIMQNNS